MPRCSDSAMQPFWRLQLLLGSVSSLDAACASIRQTPTQVHGSGSTRMPLHGSADWRRRRFRRMLCWSRPRITCGRPTPKSGPRQRIDSFRSGGAMFPSLDGFQCGFTHPMSVTLRARPLAAYGVVCHWRFAGRRQGCCQLLRNFSDAFIS
ncbi:hypothetical protein BDW02DRAFT_410851 [Decorospora gaudefroyi]|uniref:Secreted protein n=1 Tax=Decorospora gaudefroyi TaxID=184978 RepID=A0A6A5K8V4_9PLEO|nr:hypothetical protein BDW02DRAFT_410851 [Decorospora gaudefroyi]